MKFQHDSLYYGDCIDVMREWPAACADLCYLDPPFKSDADYNGKYPALPPLADPYTDQQMQMDMFST